MAEVIYRTFVNRDDATPQRVGGALSASGAFEAQFDTWSGCTSSQWLGGSVACFGEFDHRYFRGDPIDLLCELRSGELHCRVHVGRFESESTAAHMTAPEFGRQLSKQAIAERPVAQVDIEDLRILEIKQRTRHRKEAPSNSICLSIRARLFSPTTRSTPCLLARLRRPRPASVASAPRRWLWGTQCTGDPFARTQRVAASIDKHGRNCRCRRTDRRGRASCCPRRDPGVRMGRTMQRTCRRR
jgi:hypothetical protein